ncbi:MAG: CapA family protein [Elainella sp. Prado103]|nr:CapA family protein [Elainella sp. Prado103]
MANLDSSWQASVIKLAHAGNSQAIAFWLNHYLVPQGVCAQVVVEPTGNLHIRIVCRQAPDRERLVRFICHRLCKLNSEVIRQVRITAQMVGSPSVLWEQSARIIPPAERQTAAPSRDSIGSIKDSVSEVKLQAQTVYAFAGNGSGTSRADQSRADQLSQPGFEQPRTAQRSTVAGANSTHLANSTAHPTPSKTNHIPVAIPAALSSTAVQSKVVRSKSASKSKKKAVRSPVPPAQFKRSPSLSRSAQLDRGINLKQQWQNRSQWGSNLQAWTAQTRSQALESADRSIQWFASQTSSTRAIMLGGAAVAAFLIGCSFELVGYYADSGTLQQSKATLTGLLRSVPVPSGSVKTAIDRSTIIRQPVLNPEDPTISLVFTHQAALTRLKPGQVLPPASTDHITPLVTRIETFRLSDMLVTNLSDPLATSSPQSASGRVDQVAAKQSDLVADPFSAVSSTAEPGADDPSTWTDPSEPPIDPGDPDNPDDPDTNSALTEGSESESETATKKAAPLRLQELLANGIDVVNLSDSSIPAGTAIPETANSTSSSTPDAFSLLQHNQIHPIGAGANLAEARRPVIFEVKGKRIAYLGYSDSSPQAASETRAGVNIGVNPQMEADIKAIRDQVDWIVVNFNWNRALRAYPEDWQVSLTHAAIDHGADLVVGYHPITTQGSEIYNGRAIVYSLGSAVEEYSKLAAGDYDTAALKVTLKDHIMELEFLPIQVRRGQAEVAKGELGSTLLQYLEQASSLFDQPLRSPTSLNAQIRLSLPAAPDTEMPTDPFISYPEPALGPEPQP